MKDYLQYFRDGLITEQELARLSPEDYEDLQFAEKAENDKWNWLEDNLGVS